MNLPTGWASAELGALATKIGSGATPTGGQASYASSGVPLIRSMNVHFGGFEPDGIAYLNEAQAQALDGVTVQANDVLLNITGASIGRVCLVPELMSGARVNQHVCIIRPVRELLPSYIERFLASPGMQRWILEENYGFTRQALTKGMIEQLVIPVPPWAEQRRIVTQLDALFARLARARAELDHVGALAIRLREKGLAQAFSGRLIDNGQTEESDLPTDWIVVRFDEVAEIASNLVSPDTIADLPHIAPNHIESGRPKLLPYRTIREDGVISGKHRFFPGQLLYSKIRPYLRKVVEVNFEGGCSADMYPINPRCHPRYLMYWMLSPQFTWLATRQEGRTVLPKINQVALSAIPTPLAPEPIQAQIAAILDAVFARADRLEAEATRARTLLDQLEAAILTKAFKGELVPQDPDDEPASLLLERINVARAQELQSQPKRGRKATAPRPPREKTAMTKSRQDDDVKNKPYLADMIRKVGGASTVEELFKLADLQLTDFYKQLAWEVDRGHIIDRDNQELKAA